MNSKGEFETVISADLRQMKAYIEGRRPLTTPLDDVAQGKTGDLAPSQAAELVREWEGAGATWWVESLWKATPEQAEQRLRKGPLKQ
jgi:hypothetical protein